MTNPLITDRMLVKVAAAIRRRSNIDPRSAHKFAEEIMEQAFSGWTPPWVEPLAQRWYRLAREREQQLGPCGCDYEYCAKELRAAAVVAHPPEEPVPVAAHAEPKPRPDARSEHEGALCKAIADVFGSTKIRRIFIGDDGRVGAARHTHIAVDFPYWHRRRFQKLMPKMIAAARKVVGAEGELTIEKYVERDK